MVLVQEKGHKICTLLYLIDGLANLLLLTQLALLPQQINSAIPLKI